MSQTMSVLMRVARAAARKGGVAGEKLSVR